MDRIEALYTFHSKHGMEDQVLELVGMHWATLHRLGLVTDEPAHVLKCRGFGGTRVVEYFAWKDADAARLAAAVPEVASVWQPLVELTESIELDLAETVPVNPLATLGPELGQLEGAFPWLDGLR